MVTIKEIRLDGLLSFAPGSEAFELRNLNVLIGPNGSGKSNLIEALELLAATPRNFAATVRDGGGPGEWLWKGEWARRLVAHGRTRGQPMTSIAIYMEGGGDGRATKEALRQGTDALLRPLKQAAREKALHWRLVCCGGRSETFRRFRNEVTTASDTFVVLLVDAEESVHGSPCAHLHACDGWDMGFADDDAVHLMVQVMETWIVADSAAQRQYYGRRFDENALPKGSDLEDVSKPEVTIALKRATRHTTKRCYHKIWHAKDLLARIDVEQVKNRCPHCKRLFEALGQEIRLAGTRSGKPTS